MEFLGKLGLQRNSDGRYAGTCPLPHKEGPATSERSFYCSRITGFWHCFGANHVGKNNGGTKALQLIGFECESAIGAEFSLDEMTAFLGQDAPQGFYRQGQKPNVPNTVRRVKATSTVLGTNAAEKRQDRGKRASLWSDAVVLFPYPKGIRPLTKSTVLYSGRSQQMAVVDFLSNSWRNPVNAQYKRRKAYFNMLPKLRKGEVYCLRVAVDDWDKKVHATIKKRLERAGAEWLYFDNGLRRGCYVYLSNVPLEGWEMVPDVKSVLVDALKSIAPPARGKDIPRFRPFGGSRGWAGGAMKPVEENKDRWHVIAQSGSPTDWIQIEAELVASGIRYEQVEEYWQRSQWGPGIVAKFLTEEEALDFAVSIGYAPTIDNLAGSLT